VIFGMPVVKIDIWEGRSIEEKERLIKAIYKAFDALPDIPKKAITVFLNESKKENWGVNGGPASKTIVE